MTKYFVLSFCSLYTPRSSIQCFATATIVKPDLQVALYVYIDCKVNYIHDHMHSALYRYYADNCISGIHCVFTMATVITLPIVLIPSKHNVMGLMI